MTIFGQIFLGSVFLGLCSIFHIVLIAFAIRALIGLDRAYKIQGGTVHWILLTSVAFGIVVVAHTVQVWSWAVAFVLLDALPQIGDAIYFSLVTYTTVGYGDVTVGSAFRVFAAMEAVTGLLNFGLSTAFLVGLVARLLPKF